MSSPSEPPEAAVNATIRTPCKAAALLNPVISPGPTWFPSEPLVNQNRTLAASCAEPSRDKPGCSVKRPFCSSYQPAEAFAPIFVPASYGSLFSLLMLSGATRCSGVSPSLFTGIDNPSFAK